MEKFRRIQEAKNVLSDESNRRSYDYWLNSGINIPFEQWRNRKGHSMMHWANPRSNKLCIKENSSTGQGSDEFKLNNSQEASITQSESFLEKFRKYEI